MKTPIQPSFLLKFMTIGHNTATVSDVRYLDLVTRGLLWSCDKLNDTYLKPVAK